MSYIKKTLLHNEKMVFYTGPHFIIFYPCLIWLAIALGIILYPAMPTIFFYIAIAGTAISALTSYITYISAEYGVTDKRILMKVGFIRRNSLEIFFNKIESINVAQSIFGRIFNYGTVIICGTGGSKDPFYYIPDPLDFRRRVQTQMEETLSKEPKPTNN